MHLLSEETTRILINPSRLIWRCRHHFWLPSYEHCFKNQMHQVKLHIYFFQRFIHGN
jgi:hypothetical protein